MNYRAPGLEYGTVNEKAVRHDITRYVFHGFIIDMTHCGNDDALR